MGVGYPIVGFRAPFLDYNNQESVMKEEIKTEKEVNKEVKKPASLWVVFGIAGIAILLQDEVSKALLFGIMGACFLLFVFSSVMKETMTWVMPIFKSKQERPEPIMLGSSTTPKPEEIKVQEVVEEVRAEEKEVTVDWRIYDVPTYRRRGIALGLPSAVAEEVNAVKEAEIAFARAMMEDNDDDYIAIPS